MKRITAKYLTKLGACEEQVAIVAKEWPIGAPITVPTIRKALRLGLDVDWLASRVLSLDAWAEYERVKAEYLAPALRKAVEAKV
ncbi:MAG: hypothetical protein AMXMBFR53_36590 [Gemmatimonadota bacterium]